MSDKTPLQLAQAFVRTVDGLNSVPGMMVTYDRDKYAICAALVAAEADLELAKRGCGICHREALRCTSDHK